MGASTPASRTNRSADELHGPVKRCGDTKRASHARSAAVIMGDAFRTAAARARGRRLQVLRGRRVRCNVAGFEGFADRPPGRSVVCLTEAQQIAVVDAWTETGSDLEPDGRFPPKADAERRKGLRGNVAFDAQP